MSPTPWLALCREAVFSLGLDPACIEVLEAFPDRSDGATDLSAAEGFEPLEGQARQQIPRLARRIVATLDGEVDRDQAELFARRFLALEELLGTLSTRVGEARILQVGSCCRAAEILAAPAPRALRVRALVDYYTSHASLLHHRQRLGGVEPPSLEELAARVGWTSAGPDLEHALIAGESDQGPVRINLLRTADIRLQALDCRRMTRAAAWSFEQQVARTDATAAISGGFFLYSEADIEPPSRRTDPVGLLLRDGEVLSPPVFFRATLAQDAEGRITIRRMGLAGVGLTWRDGSATTIATSNDLRWLGVQPAAFNRAWGPTSPDHGGVSIAIVGHRVLALAQGALPIPLAGFVLALPQTEGRRHAYAPVARVAYTLPSGPGGVPLHTGMAGGPLLLDDGRIQLDLRAEDFTGTAPPATFSGDETFDNNLLPRMAAGLDEQGRLVLAAIDGRNFHRAPGLTLGATARLMQALGCLTAMNLDGGSSKRMVLDGRVLDLPTTELIVDGEQEDPLEDAPVRPVHTALLLHGRPPDAAAAAAEATVPPADEAEAATVDTPGSDEE